MPRRGEPIPVTCMIIGQGFQQGRCRLIHRPRSTASRDDYPGTVQPIPAGVCGSARCHGRIRTRDPGVKPGPFGKGRNDPRCLHEPAAAGKRPSRFGGLPVHL
jgi:hypothetical protein